MRPLPLTPILGCKERVILTGTMVDAAHPDMLTARLYALNIRCFELKVFAESLRDQVRDNAIQPASRRIRGLRTQASPPRLLPAANRSLPDHS